MGCIFGGVFVRYSNESQWVFFWLRELGLRWRIKSRAALDLYARPGSCGDHSPNTPFALKHKHDEVAYRHSSVGIALYTPVKSSAWTKVMITKPTC